MEKNFDSHDLIKELKFRLFFNRKNRVDKNLTNKYLHLTLAYGLLV